MSYILDALKKSEQERGSGSIPDVQTVHSSSLNYRNDKTIYWPYLLIAAVILNLLAIVYFIFDKENTVARPAKPQQSEVMENTRPALNAVNNTQPTAAVDDKKQTIVAAPVVSSNIELEATNQQTETTVTPTSKSPVTTKAPEQAAHKIAGNQISESGNTVLEYYDLPDSIKQQLPAIIISAHVYSTNPLQRSIVVNNNFMEEGEYVIDDLILHEITTDGAIFNHKGTLFHYGVVSTWQ